MGLRCQCQVDRLCFGKELFIYLYVHVDIYIYIFMKSLFPKHDFCFISFIEMALINSVIELALIAFWKRALHMYSNIVEVKTII